MAALFLAHPYSANAGVFSFLSDIFKGSDETSPAIKNSQNMSLLQAALNSDANAGLGGGDITIVNQSALLPDSGPLGTIADVSYSKTPDRISLYVVRDGDTISEIADLFGVSANTIRWANNIKKGESLSAHDTLVILPVSGVQYTVKKGDTLESIAKAFKADSEEIARFNDLAASAKLNAGDVVIVPNGEISTPPSPKYTTKNSGGKNNYAGPSYFGYYIRPVVGGNKTQGLHGHNGVDLASACGAPVLASADGPVVVARNSGWNAGYGLYVVLDHDNGTQTLYAHLNQLVVNVGSQVIQGQVIGYVGSTGKSTGCHLHFEVRGARNPF